MNKHDYIFIILVLFVIAILFIVPHLIGNSTASTAYVYYDDKLVKTLDLSIDKTSSYTIEGYNGDVVIETKKNSIRVKEETSPLNLCSKQGWVSSSFEPIVCLPNKVIIKIISTDDKVDAVVR